MAVNEPNVRAKCENRLTWETSGALYHRLVPSLYIYTKGKQLCVQFLWISGVEIQKTVLKKTYQNNLIKSL